MTEDIVQHNINISTYVELLDVMGTDATVVNAARVSMGAYIPEDEPLRIQDEKLISYLARNNHITPFFHPIIRFRIKMPIFVAREWYRHTIGFARNEISRRYVTRPVECLIPLTIREKHPNKKQGSKNTEVENRNECIDLMRKSMEESMKIYRKLLKNDVAPEIARCVLPQSMMTEFIETGSLSAYARLYHLRYDDNAQDEIKAYAYTIGNLIKEKFPISWNELTKK